jgi:VanZ family protein
VIQSLLSLLHTVWEYLGQMAWLALPVGLGFFFLYPIRKRRLEKLALGSGLVREVGLMLFVMSIFAIVSVTLRPPGGWGAPLPDRVSPWENVNFIPFRMFQVYKAYWRWGNLRYIIINFLGNMMVFLPLGFFPALLFRRERWWRSVLVGGGISVFVECGQYFLMRQSDVDDVLLNTLGALAGYWLFLLLRRLCPEQCRAFRCH